MHTKALFKGIISDLTFKYVFSKKEYLRDLINSYFEYIGVNKKYYFSKIEAQSFIKAHNRKLKNFFGDIVAVLDTEEIISLGAYSKFSKREYHKSLNYMCRLYSNQIYEGKNSYEKCKKVISLNFINSNYRRINNMLVNTYKMKNDITNKVIDNGEIEMILVRLDMVKNIPYNQDVHRFIRWLKLINAKTLEELKQIGKGDKLMEDAIAYVTRYLNGPLNHTFEDYVAEKEYLAEEKGEKKGKKAGLLETAKNMLKKDIPRNTIIEVTGLSESELLKLEKSLN